MSATLKAIHASRRQVAGLEEEDDWRAFLERVTGERSLRVMNERARQKVVDALRDRGAGKARPFRKSDKPHVRKVFAIWGDMCRQGIPANPTRAGLRAFVAKMTAGDERPEGVGNPEWLGVADARRVTEALKSWRARELARKGVSDAGG